MAKLLFQDVEAFWIEKNQQEIDDPMKNLDCIETKGLAVCFATFDPTHSYEITPFSKKSYAALNGYIQKLTQSSTEVTAALYNILLTQIEEYLSTKVISHVSSYQGILLLKELLVAWESQQLMCKWISKVFFHLNKSEMCVHGGKETLPSICFMTFYLHIFKVVQSRVADTISFEIERERSGIMIESNVVRDCIRLFRLMGSFCVYSLSPVDALKIATPEALKAIREKISRLKDVTDIPVEDFLYVKYIEDKYLEVLAGLYRRYYNLRLCGDSKSTRDFRSFFRDIENDIKMELVRFKSFMRGDSGVSKKFIQACLKVLITEQEETIRECILPALLGVYNARNGKSAIAIYNDNVEGTGADAIRHLQALFNHIVEAAVLTTVDEQQPDQQPGENLAMSFVEIFEHYIINMGETIIGKWKNVTTKDSSSSSSLSSKAATKATTDNSSFISDTVIYIDTMLKFLQLLKFSSPYSYTNDIADLPCLRSNLIHFTLKQQQQQQQEQKSWIGHSVPGEMTDLMTRIVNKSLKNFVLNASNSSSREIIDGAISCIDTIIRKSGTEIASEECCNQTDEIDSELQVDKYLRIFEYMQGKDEFVDQYKRSLSRRLLTIKNGSFITQSKIEIERVVVGKIKSLCILTNCGVSLTKPLEEMLTDVSISIKQDSAYEFQTFLCDTFDTTVLSLTGSGSLHHSAPVVTSKIQFNPMVLWWGWSIFKARDFTGKRCLPLTLSIHQDIFKAYYSEKYPHRKLLWRYDVGQVTLHYNLCASTRKSTTEDKSMGSTNRSKAASKYVDLLVVPLQAMVLMMFDNVSSFSSLSPSVSSISESSLEDSLSSTPLSCSLSYDDILYALGRENIDEDDLKKLLSSLCHAKLLLSSSGSTAKVSRADTFCLNSSFASKVKQLTIPLPSTFGCTPTALASKANDPTDRELEQAREIKLDSVIVRILKAKKLIAHSELVGEIFIQVKQCGFKPTVEMIKRRIASLIENDYMERDEEHAQTYKYIP